jgi:hypothetical protein
VTNQAPATIACATPRPSRICVRRAEGAAVLGQGGDRVGRVFVATDSSLPIAECAADPAALDAAVGVQPAEDVVAEVGEDDCGEAEDQDGGTLRLPRQPRSERCGGSTP